MSKIFILGGGFIASNLIEKLIEDGREIILLTRSVKNKYFENIYKKVTFIEADFSNMELITNILKSNDIDIVIHLISSLVPNSSFDDFYEDIQKNFIQTIFLINTMNKLNIKKIIYFSSGGSVYGNVNITPISEEVPTNPITYYGLNKLTIENYIKMENYKNNLNYMILRPSNPYGKYQNIFGKQGFIAVSLGKILNNQDIEIWGNGNNIRDYIYIEDMCNYLVSLINHGEWNNIYNIGSGEGTSLNNIIEILKKVTDINFNVIYKDSRNIDVSSNVLDVSKLKKTINYNKIPTLTIYEGIKKFWGFVNENS